MRVLHLVAIPQLTGAAEPVLDLVRAQRALGATVELRIDTKRPGNLKDVCQQAGETLDNDLVLSTKSSPLELIRDWVRLRRLLGCFDITHVHLSHDHALAALARSRRGPLLVRTIHASRALEPGVARRWLLRRAHGLTVSCEDHRRELQEGLEVSAEKILVLSGSVDLQRFRPNREARVRIREESQVSKEQFIVGTVARFQAGRKHEIMVRGLALALKKAPHLRLWFIGHGETEPAIRAQVTESGLSEFVRFCGYKREDLNDWVAACDASLWLVPGNDATSRAVLQAMAAGVPVIGGRVGAIAENVLDTETGLLVAPDSPEAVAEAMVALASHPEKAQSMGAKGRESAERRFDPIVRGKRSLDFYRALQESSARSS